MCEDFATWFHKSELVKQLIKMFQPGVWLYSLGLKHKVFVVADYVNLKLVRSDNNEQIK